MPKGYSIGYNCSICNNLIYGTGTFIRHLNTHNITPETYRYQYMEGHLNEIPKCKYCGNEIVNKSVPFRDSLEFCNECRYIATNKKTIETRRLNETLSSGTRPNLSNGCKDADFMFSKMASRVDVSKPCILYLVKNDEFFKIGFTFNFKNRYKNLPKEIIRKVEFKNSYNCILSECNLHNYFEGKSINDERPNSSEFYDLNLLDEALIKFDEQIKLNNI